MLARDAAEILWEMVAMGEGGGAVADMKGKAEQLQAQLRGLIGDYQVSAAEGGWVGRSCGAEWCTRVGGCCRGCAGVSRAAAGAQQQPARSPSLLHPPLTCCPPCAQGGDEALFARAFESFDMLSRCLEEQNAPAQPPPAASAAPPSALAPPPGAAAAPPPAVAQPPADEAPLISFD